MLATEKGIYAKSSSFYLSGVYRLYTSIVCQIQNILTPPVGKIISRADRLSAVELLRIVNMSSDDKHLHFTVDRKLAK